MASAAKDKEHETELHMRQVLEAEGFQVTRIPSQLNKTADYRVCDDQDKYLIEVKHKEDHPQRLADFERDFIEKGEATRNEPGGHNNAIAKIIRKAADQLKSSSTDPVEFKIIWFAARGQSPELQIDQFRSTLYGEVRILLAAKNKEIPCFYYTFNEFYKLPHIDGAIASSEDHAGFYLNTFSPRAHALKQTRLFRMFERSGNVCDPFALEASGGAMIFDQDTDRGDRAALYMLLVKKYGYGPRELIQFDPDVVIARIGL